MELANKMHVAVVEAAGAAEEEATALSLSRVQGMLGAAARQLVAGGKWVTKDVFDGKVAEVRKEYFSAIRQIQQQVEDFTQSFLTVAGNGGSPSRTTGSPPPRTAGSPGPPPQNAAIRLPGVANTANPG